MSPGERWSAAFTLVGDVSVELHLASFAVSASREVHVNYVITVSYHSHVMAKATIENLNGFYSLYDNKEIT